MKAFGRILFPVDLSEISPKIAKVAAMMTRTFDAELHLLFVARVFEYLTSIYVPHPSIDNFHKEIMDGAEKRLAEFRDEHFKDFAKVQWAVRGGDIAEEIISYVREQYVDLLILGTHGRKGIDRVVFGSVADRVAKMSPVPVLLVNPHRGQ
jgi:nucleotide-binding universal stress UspA family protein